jgi:hypothetical protein
VTCLSVCEASLEITSANNVTARGHEHVQSITRRTRAAGETDLSSMGYVPYITLVTSINCTWRLCSCPLCRVTGSKTTESLQFVVRVRSFVFWLHTKAFWKICGLVAVRRLYAEGGGDCYAKLYRWG